MFCVVCIGVDGDRGVVCTANVKILCLRFVLSSGGNKRKSKRERTNKFRLFRGAAFLLNNIFDGVLLAMNVIFSSPQFRWIFLSTMCLLLFFVNFDCTLFPLVLPVNTIQHTAHSTHSLSDNKKRKRAK